jgi:excisionase family DNA binding protein
MDEQHEYLKVPEVARIIRVARSRAYELVAEGEIPSIRIGRSVKVSRRDLERWLEEQRQPSTRRVQASGDFAGAAAAYRLIRYPRRSMIDPWCRIGN